MINSDNLKGTVLLFDTLAKSNGIAMVVLLIIAAWFGYTGYMTSEQIKAELINEKQAKEEATLMLVDYLKEEKVVLLNHIQQSTEETEQLREEIIKLRSEIN